MQNVFIFILTAFFWGGSFIVIKPLVEIVPPMTAASLRLLIAILFLLVLFPVMKIPLRLNKDVRKRIWLTGLFAFAFPFALLFWGERSISPGLAGILNGTVPIFVFIFGAVFTPGVERITKPKVLGLILGLCGVVTIFFPKVMYAQNDSSLLGAFAVLIMSVSYAVSVLLNRGLFTQHPDVHPFANLFHQLCSASLALVLATFFLEGFPDIFEWPSQSLVWGSLLYLAIGSTSIAFVLFYRLIKEWGSVRASTVTYIIPAAALFFDLILNRTKPQLNELIGVLIVTVGVVILNMPLPKNS